MWDLLRPVRNGGNPAAGSNQQDCVLGGVVCPGKSGIFTTNLDGFWFPAIDKFGSSCRSAAVQPPMAVASSSAAILWENRKIYLREAEESNQHSLTNTLLKEGYPDFSPRVQTLFLPSLVFVIKGAYNSGNPQSLTANEDTYYDVDAAYDPTDPLAVINSTTSCGTSAEMVVNGSSKIKVVEKTTTSQTRYWMRASKESSQPVMMVDNVYTGFTETMLTASLPNPVGDFVDANVKNRMRLQVRAVRNNKLVGFFRHSIDLVQLELVP